jgi:c-di-GMP-binding flagellar brake protein YcgR
MRLRRRRDPRLELASEEAPTCCLQDPLRFAPGLTGRILDVSRGGAAIALDAESAASLDTEHDLIVTASLPGTSMRLKRTARVSGRREEQGGSVFGLRWVEPDPADRYGQIQQARFEALLCELLGKPTAAARLGVLGRLEALLRA